MIFDLSNFVGTPVYTSEEPIEEMWLKASAPIRKYHTTTSSNEEGQVTVKSIPALKAVRARYKLAETTDKGNVQHHGGMWPKTI